MAVDSMHTRDMNRVGKGTKMQKQTNKIISSCLKKAQCFLYAMLMVLSTVHIVSAASINIETSGAEILKFEQAASEIFIADPTIADVQLSSPHTAYVFGKAPGATKLYVTDAKGKQLLDTTVIVSHNLAQLRELISAYDPHDLIEVKSISGAIILSGVVDSPKISEEIRAISEKFLAKAGVTEKNSSGTVINRMTVKAPTQIQLQVVVAEVAKNVLNQFGINWQAVFTNVGDHFNFAALTGRAPFAGPNPLNPAMPATVTSLGRPTSTPDDVQSTLGANYLNSNNNINVAVDLLSRDELVTILAKPNLVCISGETATFLAGGEFPYPVPQQQGQVTVEFKQYGVSLAFTPTVLDGNLISIRVRPEVSELDFTTGLRILNQEVPGILTRRAETTVELASGDTYAIAGLMKNDVAAKIDSLPGLGDLPILGPLFRSNRFERGDTELVILVTPYLVQPTKGKEMLTPTDGMQYASFIEQIVDRKIVKQGVQKGQAPAYGSAGVRLYGPAGFSIE